MAAAAVPARPVVAVIILHTNTSALILIHMHNTAREQTVGVTRSYSFAWHHITLSYQMHSLGASVSGYMCVCVCVFEVIKFHFFSNKGRGGQHFNQLSCCPKTVVQ